jgi:arylformamidase
VIYSLDQGHACNLLRIHMSNHAGTHIDFPAHFIPGGKTSDAFELSHLMGRCLVIAIDADAPLVLPSHLLDHAIQANDIIFFKTANAALTEYTETYTAISLPAAQYLRDKKVKIVGIDYLSVDRHGDQGFPVHHELLAHDILIVENLDLKNVPTGCYDAKIYPLKMQGVDGAPVRVSLER